MSLNIVDFREFWKTCRNISEIENICRETGSECSMEFDHEKDECSCPRGRPATLEDLKNWMIKNYYAVVDEDQKAHYFYSSSQIKLFLENPNQIQLTLPLSSPPGAPIGMYSYDHRD